MMHEWRFLLKEAAVGIVGVAVVVVGSWEEKLVLHRFSPTVDLWMIAKVSHQKRN